MQELKFSHPRPILDALDDLDAQGQTVAGPGRLVKLDGRTVWALPVAVGKQPAPTFRARNEAAWAAFFSALGVSWRYEALEPHISRAIRYMPDFWLVEPRLWCEVKAELPTPGEWQAAQTLRAATGSDVLFVVGWPAARSFWVGGVRESGRFMSGEGWQAEFLAKVWLGVVCDCGVGEVEGGLKTVKRIYAERRQK